MTSSSCPTTTGRTSSRSSCLLSPVLVGDEHNVCEEDTSGDNKTKKRTRSNSNISSGGDHYKKSTVAGEHDDTAISSMVLIDNDDNKRKQGKSSTTIYCPESRSRSFQEYDETAVQEVPLFSLSEVDNEKGSTRCGGQPVGFHDVKKDNTSSARSSFVPLSPPPPAAPPPSCIFDLPLAPLLQHHNTCHEDPFTMSEQYRYLPSTSLSGVEDNTLFVSKDELPDAGATDKQEQHGDIADQEQQSQEEEFVFLLNHKEEEDYLVRNNGTISIVANKNLPIFTDGNEANERHDHHDIIQELQYSSNYDTTMLPDEEDFLKAFQECRRDRPHKMNHKCSSSSATPGEDTTITTSIDTGNIGLSAKRRLSSSCSTQDFDQNRARKRAFNVFGGPYYSTHYGYTATSSSGNSATVNRSTTTVDEENKTFDQQPQGELLSNSYCTQSYKYGIPINESTVASLPITTKQRQCNHYDDQIEPPCTTQQQQHSSSSSRGEHEEQGREDTMATRRAKRLGKLPNQYKKLENQQHLLKNIEHDDDSRKYLGMGRSFVPVGKHQYTAEDNRGEYPISALVRKNEQGYTIEARNYVATKNKEYGRIYVHKPDNFVAGGHPVPYQQQGVVYQQPSILFESGCIFDAQSRYEDNIRAPEAPAQEVVTAERSFLRPYLSQQVFPAPLQRQQLLSVGKEKSYEISDSSSSACHHLDDNNDDILNLGFQRGQRQLRFMAPCDNFDNQGCFEDKFKIHSFVHQQKSNTSLTERHEIPMKNIRHPITGHAPSIQSTSLSPYMEQKEERRDSHPRTSLPPHYSKRNILPLSTKKDKKWLSEFQCFIRSHCIEVFSASAHDVASRMNSKRVSLGQVGIRCRFCAHLPYNERSIRSSSFPSSITRLYQCATMMVRDHFANCKAMPPSVLNRYLQLKSQSNHSAHDSKTYWMRSARDVLDLTDTDEGIRFSSDTK